MYIEFLVNIIVPIIAGIVYFIMALEVKKVGQIRKLIFGEIGYIKVFNAFIMFGIYFITRPLQNLMGPHPWPMLINNIRQFFLMSIIAPAILVGIFYWDSDEGDIPKAAKIASYSVGFFMAVIFILVNRIAIDGSKIIASFNGLNLYDAVWFSLGQKKNELVLIHLFTQLISPVGYFILATAIVRRRRHNYPKDSVYNLMPLKWRYLEIGLEVFIVSMIIAGISALFGHYYTYLWVIYFVGAIISGTIELKSVKILPSSAPMDLK
ncbi:MAG: hypothetical protein A2474_08080 [Elusimicrobia bacterium RIFOXYC2_FULL_34_12]|nr:MAG: hypothetical protein A2474_08080 [Elusimicrobia bacterium RIFOXYC2_FULL_34_12]OGS39442.1 MAG: hypothetical protein A2551_07570 [Elusimicrobia bacterium RIFOXYD2_FULL_34_30]HAM39244.1 hypothetical protein [Elusimicrobiota bacterium]